jgi:hypothetical protein
MGVNDDQLETLIPEDDATAEAEFLAAFNQTREKLQLPHGEGSTDETNNANVAATPKEEEEDRVDEDAAAQAKAEADAAAAAQEAADAEAKAKAEAEAPVVLTKAEVEALRAAAATIPQLQEELRRTRDTTAGKIGSIQQELKTIAARAAEGSKPAMKEFKRLKAEFPELGEMLEQDFAEAFAPAEPPPATPQQQEEDQQRAQAPVDPLADERVQTELRKKDQAIMDAVHPDWRTLKATPEFSAWRTQLPPAAQHLLSTTWDSSVLVEAFQDFKNWNQKRSEETAAQAQARATANKQRDKRLAHGVPATTGTPSGINAVDDDAAFEAGFKAARTGQR